MNNLLPCPFCGATPIHHEKHASVVKCSSSDVCPASLGWVPVETWNTRHTPEGWQLVPVEASIDMVKAAMYRGAAFGVGAHYQAMLAAAPSKRDTNAN